MPELGTKAAFVYPGGIRDYLRQAGVSVGIAALLSLTLFLMVGAVDRFLLEGDHIQRVHIALLAVLVMVWGLLHVQMALSLARFRIDVDEGGITIHRSGRSEYIPFTEIGSIETTGRPMWWAMRTDLKPLARTSRHMIRILRKNKPVLNFAGGLEDEERLLEILRCRLSESGGEGERGRRANTEMR